MIAKTMAIAAAIAVMLIGATAFATDSTFADGKKKYGKGQVTDQANTCGNGELARYGSCQNFNSQYLGKKNAVAIDGQQQQGEQGYKDKKDGGHDKDW